MLKNTYIFTHTVSINIGDIHSIKLLLYSLKKDTGFSGNLGSV